MRRIILLVGFFTLTALPTPGAFGEGDNGQAEESRSLIGAAIPEFTLPLLYEPAKSVRSKELLGSPYLLNVFGSWCSTCQEEHPLLVEKIKPLGIKLIGIDWKDDPESAKNWIAKFGNPYDSLVTDQDGRMAMALGTYKAPETFLVDAAGIVRYKRVGAFTSENIREELLPKIAELQRDGGK